MTESELQIAVADYLRLRYPSVLFHSDYGSGVRLTMGQAVRQKRQNGGRRAWPDMFIAKPMGVKTAAKQIDYDEKHVAETLLKQHSTLSTIDALMFLREAKHIEQKHGLLLELKKEGTRLYKKNGEPASEHIAEQAQVLEKLRGEGYVAEFAVGFEQAKKIIDDYLGGL